MSNWLAEINLKSSGTPVSMDIRKLGNRPWLFTDERTKDELALKMKLSEEPVREVFLAQSGTREAGEQVLSLIKQSGMELVLDNSLHPLERAGLSVQEDLCLVHRTSSGWILKAASLSFPSLWKLRDKIGKNMAAVHGPVDGQDPVWRRNWFIHSDDTLHQPNRPSSADPIIASNEIGKKLFVRSERQTLRALEIPGWILFTIRVQQTPLRNLINVRGEDFTNWIHNAPESFHRHKALRREQVIEIRKALD